MDLIDRIDQVINTPEFAESLDRDDIILCEFQAEWPQYRYFDQLPPAFQRAILAGEGKIKLPPRVYFDEHGWQLHNPPLVAGPAFGRPDAWELTEPADVDNPHVEGVVLKEGEDMWSFDVRKHNGEYRSGYLITNQDRLILRSIVTYET